MGQKGSKSKSSERTGGGGAPATEQDGPARSRRSRKRWQKRRRYSLPGNSGNVASAPGPASRGSTLSLTSSGNGGGVTQMPRDDASEAAVLLSYTKRRAREEEKEEFRFRRSAVQRAKSTATAAWRHERVGPTKDYHREVRLRSSSVKDVRDTGFMRRKEEEEEVQEQEDTLDEELVSDRSDVDSVSSPVEISRVCKMSSPMNRDATEVGKQPCGREKGEGSGASSRVGNVVDRGEKEVEAMIAADVEAPLKMGEEREERRNDRLPRVGGGGGERKEEEKVGRMHELKLTPPVAQTPLGDEESKCDWKKKEPPRLTGGEKQVGGLTGGEGEEGDASDAHYGIPLPRDPPPAPSGAWAVCDQSGLGGNENLGKYDEESGGQGKATDHSIQERNINTTSCPQDAGVARTDSRDEDHLAAEGPSPSSQGEKSIPPIADDSGCSDNKSCQDYGGEEAKEALSSPAGTGDGCDSLVLARGEPDREVVSEGFDPPLRQEEVEEDPASPAPSASASSSSSSSSSSSNSLTSLEALEPGQKSFREWESLVESCIDEEEEEEGKEDKNAVDDDFAGMRYRRAYAWKEPTPPRSFQWRPPPLGCSSDDLDNTTDDDDDDPPYFRPEGGCCYDSLEDLSGLPKSSPPPSPLPAAIALPAGKRSLPAIPKDSAQQQRAMKILGLRGCVGEAALEGAGRKPSTSSSSNACDSLEDVRGYFPDGQCEQTAGNLPLVVGCCSDAATGRENSDRNNSSSSSSFLGRRRLLPAIPGAAVIHEAEEWREAVPSGLSGGEGKVGRDGYEEGGGGGGDGVSPSPSTRGRRSGSENDSGFISLDFGSSRLPPSSSFKRERPANLKGVGRSSSDFLWVGLAGDGDDGVGGRGDESLAPAAPALAGVARRPKNHDRLMELAKRRRRSSAPPAGAALAAPLALRPARPSPSSSSSSSLLFPSGAKEKIRRRKSDKSNKSAFCYSNGGGVFFSKVLLLNCLELFLSPPSGRIHSAVVSGINPQTRSVTVEWFERGETKGKEVSSSLTHSPYCLHDNEHFPPPPSFLRSN